MRSTFFGLEMGRRALQTQQKALDVTGHNIANSNTEGYTRQRATIQATAPYTYPGYNRATGPGQLGTGVEVTEIKRIRDTFIDGQFRQENAPTGEWEIRQGVLAQLESIFNEPSDTSIRSVMTQFWADLQTLANRSDDGAARKVVRQRGMDLASTFNSVDQQLASLQQNLDANLKIKVSDVNNVSQQIYDLNKQIVKVESLGDNANDLRDRRDLLVDQLSKLANVNVRENPNGSVTISMGGRILVNEQAANKLKTVEDPNNSNFSNVVWELDGAAANISSGEIQGIIYSRDTIMANQRSEINRMALRFMTIFNGQHQLGYGLDSNTDVPTYVAGSGTTAANITAWGAPSTLDFSNPQTLVIMVDNNDPQVITLDQNYADADALVTAINSKLSGATASVDTVTGQLKFTSNTTGDSSSIIVSGDAADELGFGRIFFAGSSAADMSVDSNIDNVDHIAAASNAPTGTPAVIAPGDNGNALALVALQHDYTTMGKYTFDDYYRGITSTLGVDSEAAQKMLENQTLVLSQIDSQRQQVAGVSLDEEMTNMIKFQQAYNAAARIVTTVDEMLDTLISRMGVVGR